MPNLKKEDADKVKILSQVRAVSLQILDFEGKNWQFSVPKLFNRIEEDKTKILVKDGKVTIAITKKLKTKHWSDLYKVK